MSFVHLHLHSQYSVLDGAIKIKELVSRVKELGMPAVAVTDHGTMHGAVEFYQAATAEGIKPIIGCEVYITSGSRHDKRPHSQGGPRTHHLTLHAANRAGYQNLCKLVTLGYREGFYFKPRIDHELLEAHSEGIVCLSGCISSELSLMAQQGNIEGARDLITWYQRIFGERFFLEIMPHPLNEQRTLNKLARELSKELSIPLVATNDCHYLHADDALAQEVLTCISTGKNLSDENRMRHTGDTKLHVKSLEEMLRELPGDEEAIRNTLRVADLCDLEFDFKTYYMPAFTPPPERTLEEFFADEARRGMELRIVELEGMGQEFNAELRSRYQARLDLEIELILKMGFAGYFLVVSDFIRYAKQSGIPVGPGRGSAAGSLVAYAMEITEVDPIPHKLLFERFLNPERVSLPDIDIDFCINGRDKVIEYVSQKYGSDKVAQILTFGTLKAKAAIKDVGRVLGMSYSETDRIAKLIPAPRQGFDYPIAEALKMEKRLADYAEGEGKQLMALAQKIEGLSRHTSTHAAGIVIADRPVVEFLPLMVDKEGQIVTQFSMNYVEKIGLVKFDFLGLKTLTVLHDAVKMIKEGEGKDINLNALPLNDPRTYKLISSGRTIGVFQLESSGITDMVSRLKPNCFDDLVAILALYRPGPLDAGMVDHYINRKHGREPVRYLHPLLQPILSDTYGIILYQEQIMQCARDLAGYSLGEADLLRRAMGKKKPEEMAQQRERFLSGASAKGIPDASAAEIFDQMETFARYGFNRSHSAAYAMISLQTAYLKAHYPTYFLAALMTHEMSDTDKTLKNLNECQIMGIPILAPNVNQGRVGFRVADKKIIFGLAAIRGVGEKAVERVVEIRNEGGEFRSLLDFCKRMDGSILNRRMLENFVKGGAFDWTKGARAEMFELLDDALKLAQSLRESAASPQMGLFAASEQQAPFPPPGFRPVPEWPSSFRLAYEKDALGFYLTGHPLEKFKEDLKRIGSMTVETAKEKSDGAQVAVAGVVTFLKLKNTKKGDRYATFTLEDMTGTIEAVVWPDVYQGVQNVLGSDEPIILTGRLDIGEERAVLIANTIESAIALRDRSAKEALVLLEEAMISDDKVKQLKSLLAKHAGMVPVKLVLRRLEHSDTIVSLPKEYAIEPSEGLCNLVEQLFGRPTLSFR